MNDLFSGSFGFEQINIILMAVVAAFIVFAMFWGLVRGFKKTAFRGIWLIVTALILFFITPLVTKFVMNLDFSFTGIEINGVAFTTIKAFLENMAADAGFATLLSENPVIYEIVEKIPGLILNAFIFVLLFWAFKILLWPVWAIFAAILFKKRDANGDKVKRHRFFGMLTGAVIGLLVSVITLMPVINTINLVVTVEKETQNFTPAEGGIITELAGADIVALLNSLDQTVVYQAYDVTYMSTLSAGMYTYLSTAEINGQQVSLQKEIKNAIVAYKLVTDLMDVDFDNLTEAEVASTLNTVDLLIDVVFNIGLFKAVGEDFMPYVLEKLTSGEEFFVQLPNTQNETIDALMLQGIEELGQINFSDLKDELKAVVQVVRVLNDNHILFEVKNLLDSGAEMNLETALQASNLFTDTVIDGLVNNLFNSKVVSMVTPLALSAVFDYASDLIEMEELSGVTLNGATAEQLKTTFGNLLKTSFAILNSLDLDSEFYVTSVTIPQIGKLVDIVKSYAGLTEENYTIIVNAAIAKLNALLDANPELTSSIPGNILLNLKTMIGNIADVTSFEDEMEHFGTIFEDALTLYTAFTNAESISFESVGRILDTLSYTTIVGTELNNTIKSAIDYAATLLPAEFGNLSTVFAGMKNNLDTQDILWEEELPLFEDIYDYGNSQMQDSAFMENILASSNLAEIGALLNDLKQSKLIGNQINTLLATILESVSEDLGSELEGLDEILATIIENVENAGNINWEAELANLGDFVAIFDQMGETYELDLVGAALDQLMDSQIITRDLINTIVETMLGQALGDGTGAIPAELITILTDSVIDINSFENEFTAVESLLSSLTSVFSGDLNGFDFSEFGATLDSYNEESATPSVLIQNISPFLITELFNLVSEGTTNSVITNLTSDVNDYVNNITSYETELGYVETLFNALEDTSNLTLLGTTFDTLTNSEILFNTGDYFIEMMFNESIANETNPNMVTFYTSVKQNALNSEETYAQLFAQFETVQDLNTFLLDLQEPYDGTEIGTQLNTLQGLSVVGFGNARIVANEIIIEILTTLEDEQETYNPASPEYLFLQGKIDDITTEQVSLLSATSNLNYVTIFENIVSILEETI